MNENKGIKLKFNEHVTILGRTGSGKTIFLKKICESLNRFLIFDMEGEYQKFFPNLPVVNNLNDFVKIYNTGRHNIIYDPKSFTKRELRNEFEQLVALFFNNKLENYFFVIDEASIIYPQTDNRRKSDELTFIEGLIFRGRKRGLSLIAATQRFQLLDKNVITQAQKIFCFAGMNPYDVNFLEKTSGYSSAKNILKLDDYQFIEIVTNKAYQKVKL